MWFSSIELLNFKSYTSQVLEFPEPEDGKNLVIIGGMNGYGKTTILEAIYLGLYGCDAIAYLGRAGIKGSQGYKTFLKKALNKIALEDNNATMSVSLKLTTEKNYGYKITRRWFFSNDGDVDDEDLSLFSFQYGINTPLPQENIEEILGKYLVPAHLAPFFFFDGEEAKKISEQNKEEQLQQGMENLLGVILVQDLKNSLKKFETATMRGIDSIDKENLENLKKEIHALNEECEFLSKDIASKKEESKKLKDERENILSRIMDLGGGGGDIATVADIVQQIGMLSSQLQEKEESLEEILSNKVALCLVAHQVIDKFKEQLCGEKKFIEWKSEVNTLEPKRKKLFNSFFDSETLSFCPRLQESHLKFLKNKLESAWQSLFFPPPEDASKDIFHTYLADFDRNNIENQLVSIKVASNIVTDLISDIESIKDDIRRQEKLKNRLAGVDKSGVLIKLKDNHAELDAKIINIENSIGGKERELSAIKSNLANHTSSYERLEKRFIETSSATSMVSKADRVCNLIDELIPSLFQLKLSQLEKCVDNIYKQLSHKTKVGTVKLSENGRCKILDQYGKDITPEKSAGETQLFATALLGGLAAVSGVSAPMVIDTPMGRLDSIHRKNIFDYWISNKSRQIILLSQDTEIGVQSYEEFKKRIGKTYLLEHKEIRPGFGRTTAMENKYFGDVKNG